MAYDFVLFVAEDALGAGVPGHDAAIEIHHKQGVILHAVGEETKALFAFPQGRLGTPPLTHVTDIELNDLLRAYDISIGHDFDNHFAPIAGTQADIVAP